jgi:uncharacterized protein (TIGR02996 family)
VALRLESVDRFWEIVRDRKRLIVSHGALGGETKVEVQTFFLERRAIAAYAVLVAEQRAAGFTEVFALPDPVARNPALEAVIRAHRDDPGPYDVYADWLQDHDNPFGELILLQRALEHATDPAKEARMAELRRGYGAQNRDAFTVEWQWGFWRRMRVDNRAADDNFDAPAILQPAFSRFACSQLDELRIASLRWEYAAVDVPALIAAAGAYPWAAGLRTLMVGDEDQIDLAMLAVGPVAEPISRAFPNLIALHIRAGDREGELSLAGLALPRLERLTIETCSMSRAHLAELATAKLPSLTSLELWFGSSQYGVDCTPADVATILDGTMFPHLTSLGLANFEHAHTIARTIHTAPIAPQLRHLDLSKGTLDDDALIELASHRDRLAALESINVRESFLTRRGLDVLEREFVGIAIEDGGQNDPEAGRYVAVAE